MDVEDIDQEALRIDSLIRDGVQPRFPYELKFIHLKDQHYVLVIRVHPSGSIPHRVIFGGHDKFYRRNAAGKSPMDLHELREAFTTAITSTQRILNYRTERIYDIASGNTPVPIFNRNNVFAIHIVPEPDFNRANRLDSESLQRFKEGDLPGRLRPLRSSGWNTRLNLHGVVGYAGRPGDEVRSYVQIERNGRIEAVECSILASESENDRLSALPLENVSVEHITQYIHLLTELGFAGPFHVMMSLLGVKGQRVAIPSRYVWAETEPITEDRILLPPIVIESADDNIREKVAEVFVMVWHASGVSQILRP